MMTKFGITKWMWVSNAIVLFIRIGSWPNWWSDSNLIGCYQCACDIDFWTYSVLLSKSGFWLVWGKYMLGIKIWYKTGPGMESKTDFYLMWGRYTVYTWY
jgi:hypothetical protein